MSSIFEGYNYDIFISYRQKDNKHDGWVTEFVDNLKGELEANFKEDVAVYFDENPHDRLQETHNVNRSLEEKLNCLIFIPILSQTYCDPESYAWQCELLPFIRRIGEDRFGRDVKLRNGNYASRILPIRIHDLEQEDTALFEKETGNVLRAMDFVFKTASGVKRPLKAKEDHPQDNLNKTYYNDQINKVALAIKEIIVGLKATPDSFVRDESKSLEPSREVHKEIVEEARGKPFKSLINSLFPTLLITAMFVIVVALFYPKIFNRDKFKDLKNPVGKISVAVIPFENLTGDTTLNWFRRGISSLIINGLGNSSELEVCDDQTMFEVLESMHQVNTAGISASLAREVAGKVKAGTYISGSFQGREDTYWIMLNLVNSETGSIIWTSKVEGNLKSSDYLHLADSLCADIKNYLEIKALENIADYEFREAYPKSAEAYRYFIEGMNQVLSQNYEPGIISLKKALEIDSTFTLASFYMAFAYNHTGQNDQTVLWTKKAIAGKDRVPPKYQIWIALWDACYSSKNLQDIIRYCDLLAGSGINTRLMWYDLGLTYCDFTRQYDKAVAAFERVMEINAEKASEWKFELFWDRYLMSLHRAGNHEREKEIAEIGLSAIPDKSNWIYYRQAICALYRGDTIEANEVFKKYRAKHKELGTLDEILEVNLGGIYSEANIMDQAELHYRKMHELRPAMVAALAGFLIDNDINLEEGLELVERGLATYPDEVIYLQIKGWGLYKQGKYEEALKLLEPLWERSIGFIPDLHNHLEAVKKAMSDQID